MKRSVAVIALLDDLASGDPDLEPTLGAEPLNRRKSGIERAYPCDCALGYAERDLSLPVS
jgi:hypothetical protein